MKNINASSYLFLIYLIIFLVSNKVLAFSESDSHSKTSSNNQELTVAQESITNTPKEGPKIYGYDYWIPVKIEEILQKVDERKSIIKKTCSSIADKFSQKKEIKINYALGYFDDSQGKEIQFNNINYGISPSLDIEVFYAIRKKLTESCPQINENTIDSARVLCEFKEVENKSEGKLVFERVIQIQNQNVKLIFNLTHASASENFEKNKTELKDFQKFLTLQSEDNFFNQLGKSDIVFYNGHSRNGGGPDFNPPLLDRELHVNYNGYYRVKKPGITKTIKQLAVNKNNETILGLFACYSFQHYENTFLKYIKNQKRILSVATIDYYDSVKSSMAYLEGILSGYCGDDLEELVKLDKKAYKGFHLK